MARIYVCGEALIDFVPVVGSDGQSYVPKPGGSPYNAAKAAAQAGADVSFLGGLSTDLFGDQLVADLKAYDVDITHAPRSSDPTTLAFVDLSAGDPRYAFFNNGTTTAKMDPDPTALTPVAGDILDIGSVSLIDLPGADAIADFAVGLSGKMMLAFDPNARPSMIHERAVWDARIARLLDVTMILKISTEDMEFIAPGVSQDDFVATRLSSGTALILVTDGGNGATAYTQNRSVVAPAPQVALVDTVGAGDTFMGNALAWIVNRGLTSPADFAALGDDDLEALLRVATMAAAINCTRKGCMPPTAAEVNEALAT